MRGIGIVFDDSSFALAILEITLACFSGKLNAVAKSNADIGPSGVKDLGRFEFTLTLLGLVVDIDNI